MILNIDFRQISELRLLIFSLFSDMSGKTRNIYFFHMLHKNKVSKKMCQDESQVTPTAYYSFRVKRREELMEMERIVGEVIKFKEIYK
jgi:hypothetical protein